MNAGANNCRILSTILKEYCDAAGQTSNLNKSTILFSSNTPPSIRASTCAILRIRDSTDPEKYFGILSVWEKTKYQALAYVREKMCRKVQGWSRSFLSQAGREVMIKAVINAIPTFLMMCFKFLDKNCEEFDNLISNFR